MCKSIFKLVMLMSIAVFLSVGCTRASDDSAKNGECTITPPTEPVACTMQYDPVCGCDGKTYSNACAARAAGVPASTPGACEKDPID